MRLVEVEGTYTNQQNFTNLDIHVGQSYSFLVTMDQNASTDYYIVASPRFVTNPQWNEVTGVAILQYSNSKGGASGPLPDAPNDYYDKYYSMNQAKSIRSAYDIPKVLSFRISDSSAVLFVRNTIISLSLMTLSDVGMFSIKLHCIFLSE